MSKEKTELFSKLTERERELLGEIFNKLSLIEYTILMRTYNDSIEEYANRKKGLTKVQKYEKKENENWSEQKPGPIEEIIYEKRGDDGLFILWCIDGKRGIKEIVKETNISEDKVLEIIDFMKRWGVVKMNFFNKPELLTESILKTLKRYPENKELKKKMELLIGIRND